MLPIQPEGSTPFPVKSHNTMAMTSLFDQHASGSNTHIQSITMVPLNQLSPTELIDCTAAEWMLDSDQCHTFKRIAHHAYKNEKEPLKMFIAGTARSGKSCVIHALCHLFTIQQESHRLKLTAYTGIAADNIGSVMLHTALNLNFKKLSSKALHELCSPWEHVDYLFINEVSMIGCKILAKISNALVQATGVSSTFGGINVIFAGDMAQLPPINKTCLSSQLKKFCHALSPSMQNKKRDELSGLLLIPLSC